MKKNINKTNTLIKRKNLILMLKEQKIRSNKEAINLLEHKFEGLINIIIKNLKEEITIQGRKTLKKEDIEKIFTKKEEYYEI
ncbi:hypothetical protein J4436_02955 [Candidatus Woesearchaeota archaeon]|nr:hypothetical protein [Candidatus Woesearchaeota archaeon]